LDPKSGIHALTRRRRSAFETIETELKLIAAAAAPHRSAWPSLSLVNEEDNSPTFRSAVAQNVTAATQAEEAAQYTARFQPPVKA